MNIVIMGCGRVGAGLATRLANESHSVTILDINPDAFRRLPANFRGSAIIGNGIDEGVLRRARIESADIFITVTQGDNRNLMASQIAKHIFKVPRVITRVYDHSRAVLFGELGLETFSSTNVLTEMMHATITQTNRPSPDSASVVEIEE